MMRTKKARLFGIWVILAAIVTVLVGITYVGVQQNYRMSANDPQIEIAGEIAEAIKKGAPADQIIPPGSNSTDIQNSLAAFAMIFDKDAKVLGSSGKLNDTDAVPPKSVFDKAQNSGHHYFTWEPENAVRLATVVMPVKSGENDVFVLVGKNLREVEERVMHFAYISLGAWILLLLLSGLLAYALSTIMGATAIIEKDTEVIIVEEAKQDA